jgi:hypothetical protein
MSTKATCGARKAQKKSDVSVEAIVDRWLSSKEAARYIGVTAYTLQRWRTLGTGLKWSATMGRDARYRLSDLIAFMESGLVQNTLQAKQKRKKEQQPCPPLA